MFHQRIFRAGRKGLAGCPETHESGGREGKIINAQKISGQRAEQRLMPYHQQAGPRGISRRQQGFKHDFGVTVAEPVAELYLRTGEYFHGYIGRHLRAFERAGYYQPGLKARIPEPGGGAAHGLLPAFREGAFMVAGHAGFPRSQRMAMSQEYQFFHNI